MIDQLLDMPRPYRGQIVRLEQPPSQGSAVLELLLARSDRPRADVRRWCIQAQGVLEFKVVSHEVESIELLQRHPLLWTYDQDEAELYFQGQPVDVHATIGRLYAANAVAGRGWIAFGAVVNDHMPLHALLASGSGLLAKGPLTVISAYQEVLEAEGLRCSALNRGSLSTLGAAAGPQVLILGRSYIIATEFSAQLAEQEGAHDISGQIR